VLIFPFLTMVTTAPKPIVSPEATAHESRVTPKPTPKWRSYGTPLLVLLLAIAVLVTVTRNWNSWEGGHIEQVTDDAYVRGDLTPLSTKVATLTCPITSRCTKAISWSNSKTVIFRRR